MEKSYKMQQKGHYVNLQQVPGLSGSSTQQLPALSGSSISVPVQRHCPGLLASSKQQATANKKHKRKNIYYDIQKLFSNHCDKFWRAYQHKNLPFGNGASSSRH